MLTLQFLLAVCLCIFPALATAEQPSRGGHAQQYASYTVSADWLRNVQTSMKSSQMYEKCRIRSYFLRRVRLGFLNGRIAA
jgi:hypothetical protein